MTGIHPGLVPPGLGNEQSNKDDGEDEEEHDDRQDKLEEQSNIIADLCVKATTPAIRDCLRKYDNSKQHWQIKNALGQEQKQVLVDTLEYLGVPGMSKYLASELSNKLFCRIQNLLPDICHICDTKYCIKINDKPVISCVHCGQGCHNGCILDRLGKKEDDLVGLTEIDREALVNPYASIGLFYICGHCQKNAIPQKEDGLMKRFAKSAKRSTDTDQTTAQNGENVQSAETKRSVSFAATPTLPASDAPQPTPQAGGDSEVPDVLITKYEPPPTHSNMSAPVCKHYKRARCKYGISGKKEGEGSCPFFHPKPCKRLMEHGNRGPRECTMGDQCELFHPKMCHSSLRQRKCIDPACKFMHVRGTKRTEIDIHVAESSNVNYRVQDTTNKRETIPMCAQSNTHQRQISDHINHAFPPLQPAYQSNNHVVKQNDANQGYFLDALLQWKDEILKEMDKKLSQLQSHQYHSVNVPQHMYTQSPPQTLLQPAQIQKPMIHQTAGQMQFLHH